MNIAFRFKNRYLLRKFTESAAKGTETSDHPAGIYMFKVNNKSVRFLTYIYVYVHTVEGFENSRNICEKLICVFKFRNIHYNTCRFWLEILICIYVYIYIHI